MNNQPNPPVEVTQTDREIAWPYAKFHCLPDSQMRERWFTSYYDNLSEGMAIRDFARHRITAIAQVRREALEDAARTVLGWTPEEGPLVADRYESPCFWQRRCIVKAISGLIERETK